MDESSRDTLERIEQRLARLEDKVDGIDDDNGIGCLGVVLFGVVIAILVEVKDLVEALVAAG